MIVRMSYLDREYQSLKDELDRAWYDTVSLGSFIGGEPVREFEEQLSQYLDDAYVISCGNGTDALLAAFMAVEIKNGDEVIMPAFGYISAYEMCRLLGAQPILVDINEFYSLHLEGVEKQITPRTKAIVIQHLFGQVGTDIMALHDLAKAHNLILIEDSAQAIGSTYQNKLA